MSQKKVDAYKAEKANREKIMKKEKLILTGDYDDRDCYGYFCTGFLSEWT